MVSRRDKTESEESGPEVSASAEAVEVGGDLARSFETFPSRDVPRAEFSEGASKCPAGQTECERRIPMRRKGATLVCVAIFGGAALIGSCAKPYHEENERYVFVATNINLPYWRGGGAGVFDWAETQGGKGGPVRPTT